MGSMRMGTSGVALGGLALDSAPIDVLAVDGAGLVAVHRAVELIQFEQVTLVDLVRVMVRVRVRVRVRARFRVRVRVWRPRPSCSETRSACRSHGAQSLHGARGRSRGGRGSAPGAVVMEYNQL